MVNTYVSKYHIKLTSFFTLYSFHDNLQTKSPNLLLGRLYRNLNLIDNDTMIIFVTSHGICVTIFIYNAIRINSEPQKLSFDSAIKTVSTSVSIRDLDSYQNFRIAKFPKDSSVRRNRCRKIETICNTFKRPKFDIICCCTL